MKRFPLLLAATLTFSLALPARAQTSIPAPIGWNVQTRAGGATTFTPPDLRMGEVYSVTIYDSAALDGKTLGKYLHAFAGPVEPKPGHLSAPLEVKVNGLVATGTSTYGGPGGKSLIALFVCAAPDATNIHVMRVLASADEVFARYKSSYDTLLGAMAERARDEAGRNMVQVPERVMEALKPGGEIVPGIYEGQQFYGKELRHRLRVYLYPSGEYRFKNEKDENFKDGWSQPMGLGTYAYNRNSGQLDLDFSFDMVNDRGSDALVTFCFYGRDSAGKPTIYAEKDLGFHRARTSLAWVAPLAASTSPKVVKARAEAVKAEAERYKFVVAPGKGVKAAQIQAVVHDYQMFAAGSVTDQAYLLLKDGTVHEGLPVPPDQLDVAASRRGEPKAWGKWTREGGKYHVSWPGKAKEELPGNPVLPGTPQMRLQGRYAAVRAGMNWHQIWGVTFDKAGRFAKDRRGAVSTGLAMPGGPPVASTTWDNGGSSTSVTGGGVAATSISKRNPNGDFKGTYSISGYTLTLRYDNGQVVRMPFFTSADCKSLWFESDTLMLGLED